MTFPNPWRCRGSRQERVPDHPYGYICVGPLFHAALLPVFPVVCLNDHNLAARAVLQCREPKISTLDLTGAHLGIIVNFRRVILYSADCIAVFKCAGSEPLGKFREIAPPQTKCCRFVN